MINTLKNKLLALSLKAKNTLDNTKAEGYIDSGIKIVIAVVIGALLLAGLYALMNDTVIAGMQEQVEGFFSYSGTL